MVICKSDAIKASILQLINTEINQHHLKAQLLNYVDNQSQSGFSFGELLILHYNMFEGTNNEEIYTVAAAVELLILSFDILDDLEDNDSPDKPWSREPNLALNATTALLFMSAKVIQSTSFDNKDEAVALLFQYALQSIQGQHKDLLNISQTEAEYIEMTLEKSGSLTKLACVMGTFLAMNDCPKEVKVYARLIGLIGQINNDLMDIATWDDKNDLLHRKYTLPIIYLLNRKEDGLQVLRDYYHGKVGMKAVVQQQQFIEQQFKETGAITYTEVIKRIYQNKVFSELEKLNIEKKYLTQFKKYVY